MQSVGRKVQGRDKEGSRAWLAAHHLGIKHFPGAPQIYVMGSQRDPAGRKRFFSLAVSPGPGVSRRRRGRQTAGTGMVMAARVSQCTSRRGAGQCLCRCPRHVRHQAPPAAVTSCCTDSGEGARSQAASARLCSQKSGRVRRQPRSANHPLPPTASPPRSNIFFALLSVARTDPSSGCLVLHYRRPPQTNTQPCPFESNPTTPLLFFHK